ncbi:gp53-like domain-containing protein [Kutzneria chonburiensis]|uniref:Putative tail fiber protein gp53-like C-terminal domain-containing protein n=1 Tax=Kutzneria chonburiensis TaxID=1483604 RepID=A0ABV6N2W1_9PSEU|nr:hypothetical protein [Kutzneria chonburiensis]
MTYEQRAPRDYTFGTLGTAVAVSDTTVSSTALATLGTGYSATQYLPLVIHDPSRGAYEMVWVTGHAAASQQVTVVRGREGTTAQAWASGTQLVAGPSTRDGLQALTRATLPADPHLGMRALVGDESVVVERTVGGWQPSVGIANPADVGPIINGGSAYPPANAVILVRGGYWNGPSDANGNSTVNYRTPFPNATIAVTILSNAYVSEGPFVTWASNAAGFSITSFQASTVRLANATVSISYIAIGY